MTIRFRIERRAGRIGHWLMRPKGHYPVLGRRLTEWSVGFLPWREAGSCDYCNARHKQPLLGIRRKNDTRYQ